MSNRTGRIVFTSIARALQITEDLLVNLVKKVAFFNIVKINLIDFICHLPDQGAGFHVVIRVNENITHEQTLGIITRLTLKLRPAPAPNVTAFAAAPSTKALALLLRQLKRTPGVELTAFEFMSGDFVRLASQLSGTPCPMEPSHLWYVLVESAEHPRPDGGSALQDALERASAAAEASARLRASVTAESREPKEKPKKGAGTGRSRRPVPAGWLKHRRRAGG